MSIIKIKNDRAYFQGPLGYRFPLGPHDPHLTDCVQRAYIAGRANPYRQGLPLLPGGGPGAPGGLLTASGLGPWDLTPRQAIDLFLEHQRKRAKKRTYEIRKQDLLGATTGLAARFGSEDWNGWFGFWSWIDGDAWREYKPNTIKSFISSAKALVAFCKKSGIRIPEFANGNREKMTTLQREEAPHLNEIPWTPFPPGTLRVIEAHADDRWDDHYPAALKMMIYHGINNVDIYGVDWRNVEWDRNGLGPFYVDRRSKTFEILDIPLAQPVVDALKEIHTGQTEGQVFTAMPQTNQGLDRRFAAIRQALKIPKQPRGQNGHQRFRHTFASLVDDLEIPGRGPVPRKYTKRLMGHKPHGGENDETLDVYTAIGDERTVEVIAALVKFIQTS